jgi:hypothetical protein
MAVNQLGDGSTDGVVVAPSGAKVGFYGAAPVVIRPTNSQHVTSNVNAYTATTASALMGAWMLEVTNTLLGLGIWTSP